MINASRVNFFEKIRGYGPDTARHVKSYVKQSDKSTRLESQLSFLNNCRREEVCPKTLQWGIPFALRNEVRTLRMADRANQHSVRVAAKTTRLQLHNSRTEENQQWTWLQFDLQPEDAKMLDDIVRDKCLKIKRVQDTHKNQKLDRMVEDKLGSGSHQNIVTNNLVINLSKHTLNEAQKRLLARGPGFSVAPKKFPLIEYITAVEAASVFLGPDTKAEWKNKIASEIKKSQKVISNITPSESQALVDLRKNENIMVLAADKGRAMVIMDTEDYNKKMHEHLDDGPYKKLDTNPGPKMEKELRKLVRGVEELKHVIPEPPKSGTVQSLYKTPHIRGAPKVHKAGVPLRPIVNTRGSALQPLCKYMVTILKPLVNNSSTSITNAEQLIPTLKSIKLGNDARLCSFDVKSLFTSVPRDMVLKALREKLKNDNTLLDRTILTPDQICTLIDFCMQSTFFQFGNEFYEQNSGLAMGSSLSPILAEIYMQAFEKNVLKKCPKKPILIVRYVDDYLVIFDSELNIDDLLLTFNSEHQNIELTMEMENEGQIPFLDMLLKRENGQISITVYRKPTDTHYTTPFDSNHAYNTKFANALGMFRRALRYCTNDTLLNKELNTIFSILKNQNYPIHLINKALKRAKNPNPAPAQTEKPSTTMVIPYIKNKSETIRAISKKTAKIRTAFSSSTTLAHQLSRSNRPKTTPTLKDVIYQVPCKDCNAVYIGQTKRQVQKRFTEHQRAIKKPKNKKELALLENDKNYSRIALHAKKENHKFDWENACVVLFEKNRLKRTALETMTMEMRKKKSNTLVLSHSSLLLDPLWIKHLSSKEAEHLLSPKFKVPVCASPAAARANMQPNGLAAATSAAAPVRRRKQSKVNNAPPTHRYDLRKRN
jgi:hypothetical protein